MTLAALSFAKSSNLLAPFSLSGSQVTEYLSPHSFLAVPVFGWTPNMFENLFQNKPELQRPKQSGRSWFGVLSLFFRIREAIAINGAQWGKIAFRLTEEHIEWQVRDANRQRVCSGLEPASNINLVRCRPNGSRGLTIDNNICDLANL